MKNYKKPIIILNDELCEGIYVSRGSINKEYGRNSIYMNGIYYPHPYDKYVLSCMVRRFWYDRPFIIAMSW